MKLQILLLTLISTEIELKNQFRPGQFTSRVPIVWVDGRHRDKAQENNIDTFYDRIVAISQFVPRSRRSKRGHSHQVTGVLITDQLILTSFNAFQTLVQQKDTLNRVYVFLMIARIFLHNGTLSTYKRTPAFTQNKVVCGRQVIPRNKIESIPSHMRHGRHYPLHDLMVMRLRKPIIFRKPIPKPVNSFSNYKEGTLWEGNPSLEFGPVQTDLAKLQDQIIVQDLKFASLGHLSDEHIADARYLEKEEVHPDDHIITNCDEWIPREWGHFICIRNVNNYPGIASGGMLFSGHKLYGVGAFALFKRKAGILVFTDVRRYWHLLHRTCTVSDQKLTIPKPDL